MSVGSRSLHGMRRVKKIVDVIGLRSVCGIASISWSKVSYGARCEKEVHGYNLLLYLRNRNRIVGRLATMIPLGFISENFCIGVNDTTVSQPGVGIAMWFSCRV